MPRPRIKARELRYRLAFFVTALVVLALVVTLPFSVKSVVDDVLGPATGRVFQITPRGAGAPDAAVSDRLRTRESNYTKLHLAVTCRWSNRTTGCFSRSRSSWPGLS
jgi:hypothetical protein